MNYRPKILLVTLCAFTSIAFSKPQSVVNEVRASGCRGSAGVRAPLRVDRKLSAATKRLASGGDLEAALLKAGYRARRSASLRLTGNLGDIAVGNSLRQSFCEEVTDPGFSELGLFVSGQDLWIIVATPFAALTPGDAAAVNRKVLALMNEARAKSRRCGSKTYGPAPALKNNDLLVAAARAHSKDLASHSALSHSGSDGSSPAERAQRTGYAWRVVGENVAAGPGTAEEVSAGWLSSPHHCTNIMDPRFTEMGVAYVVDLKSKSVVYWTQMFGVPR